MATEMPRIKNEVIRGNAVVRKAKTKSGQTVFQINLEIVNKDKTTRTETFVVAAENCPKHLKTGQWAVTVNEEKDRVLSAVPDTENFVGEFHDIAHAENKPPTPRVGQSTYDPQKAWVTFNLLFKVTEGEYKDLILWDFLNYNFGPAKLPDGRVVAGYFPPSSKATEALALRINALGVMEEGYIPWKGENVPGTELKNILPEIARRARVQVEENNRKIAISVVGGRIVQTKWIPTDLEGDEATLDDLNEGDEPVIDDVDAPVSETLPDEGEIDWKENDN